METSAQYESYDGALLAYRVLGAINGAEPLLCLAGGPGRDAAYLGDLGGLAAERPLVIPDLRGTGASRPPGQDPAGYAFPRLAEDVEYLREELGLERIALLGHSAAATVAQAYAAHHPERLSRLVLVTPGTRLQGKPIEDAEAIFRSRRAEPWFADALDAVARLEQTSDLDEVRDLLMRAAPGTYGAWGERQRAHAEAEGGQLNPVPRAAFWQGVDPADRATVLEGLTRCPAPVLVLTGELDGLSGVAAGDVVADCFPHAEHRTLPGCGHYPWVDDPEGFRAALRDFLD